MEKLMLYHGSRTGLVGAIRPDRSRSACDFGQGFYMDWRHRDGLYFDEILSQMAKDDAACPPSDETLSGGGR